MLKIEPAMGFCSAHTATCLLAAWMIAATPVSAQTGSGNAPAMGPRPAAPSQDGGGTLEVAPRLPTAPLPDSGQSAPDEAPVSVPTIGTAQDYQNGQSPFSASDNGGTYTSRPLPYLGLSVQYIISDDDPRRRVQGYEVVGVDPGSPAEAAGLHAHGALNTLGATGATLGAFAPPLDLIVMPLLKKAGKLGADGDLIVAIDDNRVLTPDDLGTALAALKPGDIMYFTVVRPHPDGSHDTLKVPVKLGRPRTGTDAASAR